MRTQLLSIVAGLGLFATCAQGESLPAGTTQDQSDVNSAVLRGFAFQVAPQEKITVPVIKASLPAADGATGPGVVQMPALQVNAMPDDTARNLNAAVGNERYDAPSDVIARSSGSSVEFRLLGDIMQPLSQNDHLQANVPLATLAW